MPFLLPLVGLIGGILAAEYIGAGCVTAGLMGAYCLFMWLYMRHERRQGPIRDLRAQAVRQPVILALFIAVGILTVMIHRPKIPDLEKEELPEYVDVRVLSVRQTVTGDLVDAEIISFRDSTSQRDNPATPQSVNGIGVRLNSSGLILQPGDVLRFREELRPITDSPNSFRTGFAERLRRKGIYFRQSVNQYSAHLVGTSHTLRTYAYDIRDRLTIRLQNSALSDASKQLIGTILLGDETALDQPKRASFASAGLAHILSLSGLHVGLVAALVLTFLLPLNLTRFRKTRWLAAIVFVWLYVWLTGLHLPAIRAAVMLTFYMLTMLLERDNASMNALFAAAFLILLFSPSALTNCGFQLSCICVFALVAFSNQILNERLRKYQTLYTLASMILTTVLATFASWAIVAYHFGQLPILFLPANILIAPMLPVYMGAAALLLFEELIGLHPGFFAVIVDRLTDYILRIADMLSKPEWSVVHVDVNIYIALAWTVGIILLFFAIENRNNKRALFVIGTTSFTLLLISLILLLAQADAKAKIGSRRGIIVQNIYEELRITTFENDTEDVIYFNLKEGVDTVILGKRIVYIHDNRHSKKSRKRYELPTVKQNVDLLILGNRFNGDISDLTDFFDPKQITSLRSVTVDNDVTNKIQAERSSIHYHSIREEGPFRLEWRE